jgi:LuxR family maltose regulon positive regulatory protein
VGVEQILELVESRLGQAAPPPIVFNQDDLALIPAQLFVYRSGLALLAGDIAGTIAHAGRAIELAGPTDLLSHGAAAALSGLAHWSTGDLDAARRLYADAVKSLAAAGHLPDVLGCSLGLADIEVAQGRLRDATGTFTSALRLTEATPGLRGAADMHVGLSEVLIDRNDLTAAAGHLQTAAELGEHAGLPQNAYRRRVARARLRQARGDLDGALELLDEAEPLYNTDFSPAVRPVAALRARVQIARGEVDAAERWAADRGLTPEDELTYVCEFEHITLARTLLARSAAAGGDRRSDDGTVGLLDRLLTAAEQGHRAGSAVEILVLLAVARQARGDAARAGEALDEALSRAEPEGYVRLFVDAGPTLAPLLRSVASQGRARGHARRVLAGTDGAGPVGPSRSGLVDELSARELDVLRLLRTDLSGPEIARELTVSMNTLRTHNKSIYAKLGATSRREAVRRATDLGL